MKHFRTNKRVASIPLGTKGCRRWRTGCFFLIVFFLLAICSLLALFFYPRSAQAIASERPLAVWLLIDNSNSMFEKAGVGSDPEFLRLDAARLFLTYLGVDERHLQHQASVIFFGSEAETVVALTPLTSEEQRTQLFAQIAAPLRQDWTDHLAALDLAQTQLNALPSSTRTAIILLTDGKPEWDETPTESEQVAYLTALQSRSEGLTSSDTALFIILLANTATDKDPEIANIWQPLWQTMSAATPSGAYFVAREAADLPGIYHDIVVLLTGNDTDGIVYEIDVPLAGAETTLTVPPNLRQLTLVIGKEEVGQTIRLLNPAGQSVAETDPKVRRAGGGRGLEEIWVIEQPQAGEWTLRIEGAGQITVWQDSKPAPVHLETILTTPTLTATAMAQPTIQPVPLATRHTEPPAMPFPTATRVLPVTVNTISEGEAEPLSWLWTVGAGGLLLLTASCLLLVHQARQRPHLTGSLRFLHGAQSTKGETLVELEPLHTPFLRVGCPPAEMVVASAQSQVALSIGHAFGETPEVLVRSSAGIVQLNGETLHREQRLMDSDILDLAGVQLRYENLRLRQAQREQLHRM